MLLKLAKSNQPVLLIIIPIITAIIWFNPHWNGNNPVSSHIYYTPLFKAIAGWAVPGSFTNRLLGFVFSVAIAFLLNRLNTKYIFISERSYLPSVIYLLLVTSICQNAGFSPNHIAILFFLFSFEHILDSYKLERLSYNVFDASLSLGIACLFNSNFYFLLAILWIGQISIRAFYWREWLHSIIGLLLPLVLSIAYYYLMDYNWKELLWSAENCIRVKSPILLARPQLVFLGYLAIITLLSSQFLLKILPSKKIINRKAFNLFLYLFFAVFLMLVFVDGVSLDMVYLGAIPLSFLLAQYFSSAKRVRWVEILFTTLILSGICLQFIKF